MGWSDWAAVAAGRRGCGAGGTVCAVEGGAAGGRRHVDSVGLNYWRRTWLRWWTMLWCSRERGVAASAPAAQNATVQVSFPAAGTGGAGFTPDTNAAAADGAEGQERR